MKKHNKTTKRFAAALLAALLLVLAWPISALAETPDLPDAPAQAQGGDTTPAEGGDIPTEGEGNPAEGEGNPAEGEGNPAEGEGNPAEGETAPAQGEDTPAQSEGSPVEGEGSPAEGSTTPPSADDSTPPQEDTMATTMMRSTRALTYQVPADFANLKTAIANAGTGATIVISENADQSLYYTEFDAAMGKNLTINGNNATVELVDQNNVNGFNCGIHINSKITLNDIKFKSNGSSDYFITISSGAEGSVLNNITVESIVSGGKGSALYLHDVENISINSFVVADGIKTSDENTGCVTISGANNCKIDGLTIESASPGIRFETNTKNNSVDFSNVSIPKSSAPVTSANSSITNNGSSVNLVDGFKIGLDLLNNGGFGPTVFFKSVEDVYKNHSRFSGQTFKPAMNSSIADINYPGVFYAFYRNDTSGNTIMLNNRDIPSGSLVKLVLVDGATSFSGDIKFNNSRELTIQAVLLDDLDATGDQIKFNGNEIVNSALPNDTTLQNFDFSSLGLTKEEFETLTGYNAPEGRTNTTNVFFNTPTPPKSDPKDPELDPGERDPIDPETTPTPTPTPSSSVEPEPTPEPSTQPTATPTPEPSREPITVTTQEPTPAPTATPAPVVPTPPQDGGTTPDEGETTPTNVVPVIQDQLNAQTGHTLLENILNNNVPLGNFAVNGAWSLLNLIITLAGIVLGIVNVIRWVVKRREVQYTSDGEAIVSQRHENIMLVLRGISVACGLLVGLAFLLLENLTMPVAFINAYTPLFILLGLLQPLVLLGAWIVRRRRDRAEEQLLQEAEAENGTVTEEDLRQWVPQSMDH